MRKRKTKIGINRLYCIVRAAFSKKKTVLYNIMNLDLRKRLVKRIVYRDIVYRETLLYGPEIWSFIGGHVNFETDGKNKVGE